MNLRTENIILQGTLDLYLQVILAGIAIGILMLLALIWVSVWSLSQPRGRLNCNSFGSYLEALVAYKRGATYLDGDGDGIPCQTLYKRDYSAP